MFSDFFLGLAAHARGIRFALARKSYLGLTAIPFLVTILLYALGFTLFTNHSDQLLGLLWTPDQTASTGFFLAALAWLYLHVVKYLLYVLAFTLMYFLFMVTANILAAPLYDHIANRLSREAKGVSATEAPAISFWRSVVEELKKAVFVAAVPLLLVFVPLIGQILAPLAAAMLLAYDFVDYSLCLDAPRFADRLRAMAKRPLLLLGFGLPLLVPLLNLLLYPFAILGSCLLYHEAAGRALPTQPRK